MLLNQNTILYNTRKSFMQNNFSYPLKPEDIGSAPLHYDFQAEAAELKVITEILRLPEVLSLAISEDVKYNKAEHLIEVKGKIDALVEQISVISLKKFKQRYKFYFARVFDTRLTLAQQRELENFDDISVDIPDVMINGKIDLKEIALEELALHLDDFPKQKGEVFTFTPDFSTDEDKPNNPFAVLENLKKL